MRAVTSVFIQIHKSVILEMTLEVTIPKPVTGMILIAWYMHLLTFKFHSSSTTQVEEQQQHS